MRLQLWLHLLHRRAIHFRACPVSEMNCPVVDWQLIDGVGVHADCISEAMALTGNNAPCASLISSYRNTLSSNPATDDASIKAAVASAPIPSYQCAQLPFQVVVPVTMSVKLYSNWKLLCTGSLVGSYGFVEIPFAVCNLRALGCLLHRCCAAVRTFIEDVRALPLAKQP